MFLYLHKCFRNLVPIQMSPLYFLLKILCGPEGPHLIIYYCESKGVAIEPEPTSSPSTAYKFAAIAVNLILEPFRPPVVATDAPVPGNETSIETLERVEQFCKRIGKVPITCKDRPGFVVNRPRQL